MVQALDKSIDVNSESLPAECNNCGGSDELLYPLRMARTLMLCTECAKATPHLFVCDECGEVCHTDHRARYSDRCQECDRS